MALWNSISSTGTGVGFRQRWLPGWVNRPWGGGEREWGGGEGGLIGPGGRKGWGVQGV